MVRILTDEREIRLHCDQASALQMALHAYLLQIPDFLRVFNPTEYPHTCESIAREYYWNVRTLVDVFGARIASLRPEVIAW